MPDRKAKSQAAYLHDMLEASRLVRQYTQGVLFEEFGVNPEKRDAVAMRLTVLGESACRIDPPTEAALSSIPFKRIRGLRKRTAHDYGAVDLRIVWAVVQEEMEPLIAALEAYLDRPIR